MFGLKANKHKVCIDLFTCLSCSAVIVIIKICCFACLVLVIFIDNIYAQFCFSYKLWYLYLKERRKQVRGRSVNKCFISWIVLAQV